MVGFPPTPAEIVALIMRIVASHTFVTIVFFPGFIHLALIVIILTWYERKLLARIQLRIGPLYAGGPGERNFCPHSGLRRLSRFSHGRRGPSYGGDVFRTTYGW